MALRHGLMIEHTVEFERAVAFASEHQFDFVELNMEFTFHRDRVDPEHVQSVTDEHGLDVIVHLPYRLDPGSPHRHAREGACRELEAAIEHAAEFGAEKSIVHATSHADTRRWPPRDLRQQLYESLRRLDAFAGAHGVQLCAENLKHPFDASEFPRLFDRTSVAGCLDTGHAYVTGQAGADQADLIAQFGERFSHIHLNDTRLPDDDEHLPVGMGQVEFAPLAATLRETDWTGTCTHEIYAFDLDSRALGKTAFTRLLAAP